MSNVFYLFARKHSFKIGTDLCKDIWWYAILLKNHVITALIQGGQGPPKALEPMTMIIIVLILWLRHHVILKYHRCSKQECGKNWTITQTSTG